ncbi:MAG: hypothetical protein ACJAT7_000559 [Psychromonas sp.]|uniref:hypothetical protein n=1 Tax=Psychromonas sp. TaxID=1884585 RepID=UPI0039E71127
MKTHALLLIATLLSLTGCGGSSTPINNATNLDHIYTYLETEIPEAQLDPASCVNYSQACTVQQLPFIALSYPQTRREDIMARVVVSHDWMGARFQALLTRLPTEVITLMGSITAIVIADNIRPSFYWTGSGAIYIDPADLWLTNEEKSTILKSPDYRDDFGELLAYDFFHRFIKDGQYAYFYYPLDGAQERDIEDIVVPMASLLFHELAHANDFMPQQLISSLDLSQTTRSELNRLAPQRLNIELATSYPLTSQELFNHAAILYQGTEPTEQQQSDSAAYLGSLMQEEGANHLYSYLNQAEDVAMLFQASMLKKSFDVDMDSAFVIKPQGSDLSCADYLVGWGVRNRIADTQTKPRAQFISQRILPDSDFNNFFDNLESEQTFPALINWCNTSLSETRRTSFNNKGKVFRRGHQHGLLIR